MRINFTPSTLVDEAIVWRSESDTRPGLFHYTMKLRHGGIICTCEGYQYQGHCKHVMNLDLSTKAVQEIMTRWRRD